MIAEAVIDASVAVKWVVDEPESGRARLLAAADLAAPDFLLVECANVLWKKVALGEIVPDEASSRLGLLMEAPVAFAPTENLLLASLGLAVELEHPVYDCLYLTLAADRGVPLVTADKRFAQLVRARPRLAPHVLTLAEIG